jgi:hypothetical protein
MRGRRISLIGTLTATGVTALLATLAVDVAPAADLTPTAVVTSNGHSAHVARPKKKTHRALCSSIVSLGAIRAATGLVGTKLAQAPRAFDARHGFLLGDS